MHIARYIQQSKNTAVNFECVYGLRLTTYSYYLKK